MIFLRYEVVAVSPCGVLHGFFTDVDGVCSECGGSGERIERTGLVVEPVEHWCERDHMPAVDFPHSGKPPIAEYWKPVERAS